MTVPTDHQDQSTLDRFGEAVRHHQAGRLPDAERLYRRILEDDPENVTVLSNLSLLAPQADAEYFLRKALILRPDYVEAHINLGDIFKSQGKFDDAVLHYQQALLFRPSQPDLHFDLGAIFREQGKLEDAIQQYKRAIELRPDYAAAHNGLGDVFGMTGNLRCAAESYGRAAEIRPDDVTALFNLGAVFARGAKHAWAVEWFQRVLAVDPNHEKANLNLVCSLECDGRLDEARLYRNRISSPQPLLFRIASEQRRTVLFLWKSGGGNVPVDALVTQRYNTHINWNIEAATDEQEKELPPYDLVFNAIGEAELIGPSLPRLTRFLDGCRRPFLNPPERVVLTRRDLMPRLLGDIPNVVVPSVMRLCRAELGDGLAAKLAAGGVTCPFLVRPITGQGGQGVILVETAEQLANLEFSGADGFYFISYHDYRSPDGYYRKYRTVFVDRRPYHYHLAVSPRWLVHYFSAEMLAEPWKREEERRFLENPDEILGPTTTAAIEAIGRRMDMDYAGIDYSVLPDGRVLVFEANATMLVYPPDSQHYSYKQSFVEAIFAAVEAMLERRGGGGLRA